MLTKVNNFASQFSIGVYGHNVWVVLFDHLDGIWIRRQPRVEILIKHAPKTIKVLNMPESKPMAAIFSFHAR
jgi:hypothetical protein